MFDSNLIKWFCLFVDVLNKVSIDQAILLQSQNIYFFAKNNNINVILFRVHLIEFTAEAQVAE